MNPKRFNTEALIRGKPYVCNRAMHVAIACKVHATRMFIYFHKYNSIEPVLLVG